ncbi:MAG TPA: AAA family ATPase [Methanocorpusculum sp.]|nr:AAA family ATPase [Methanocorpusculum sp.]HJK80761.1 AAA family ATPase [Methanocorpusculum sp.]
MLVKFTVSNFLSFNQEQTFSMISGKVRSKQDHVIKEKKQNILKFSAIFGANASGKSNMVKAMDFASETIRHGLPINIMDNYCRTSEMNRDRPTKFEFEIKIYDRHYQYGFNLLLHDGKILEEWLYDVTTPSARNLFTRTVTDKSIILSKQFTGEARKTLKIYAEGMQSNDSLLYLTEMNRNKSDLYTKYPTLTPLRDVYRWFRGQFVVNYPEDPMSPAYFVDDGNLNEINTIISELKLGITRCKLEDGSMEDIRKYISPYTFTQIREDIEKRASLAKKKGEKSSVLMIRGPKGFFILQINPETMEITVQNLRFEHERKDMWFSIFEESDGTKRVLDLIEVLISAKTRTKKIYVIDEIDRCLHPILTYNFIKLYLSLIKDKEIQLIVTTHEAHLMDLQLLRRDEIRFMNKEDDGSSSLESLDSYNERFDKVIGKAYLSGRYGGIPMFDDYFPIKEQS